MDRTEKRITELEAEMAKPGFWDAPGKSQPVIQELKSLKAVSEPWSGYQQKLKELMELVDIIDAGDEQSLAEIKTDIAHLCSQIEDLEFRSLLNGEEDKNNAILSINAGAGGTESCDWAQMLLRMYTRWAANRNYETQTIDLLPGEEAGIKNTTLLIKGMYAFGYLKAESGVHRLVRISPFDANRRRHTSFASIDVIPEIADEIKVEIKEEDLRIDTFRAGGRGGQHVNVTDSAVRITHLPSRTVVQCQNERSQRQNKMTAMKILRARLYEKEKKEREEKLAKNYAEKQRIEWGSQIRSYVMHPYSMVKDHRTDVETSNVEAVMNGEIDTFIEAYLKQRAQKD